MRRTRLTDRRQARLWPDWRHFAFLTDLHRTPPRVDAFHRNHAVIELDIRDVKKGPGWSTCPRVTSTPTAPGCSAPCWLTTSSAGPSPSDSPDPSKNARRPHALRTAHHHPRPTSQPRRHPHLRGSLNWPWGHWFLDASTPSEPFPPPAERPPADRRRRRQTPGADNPTPARTSNFGACHTRFDQPQRDHTSRSETFHPAVNPTEVDRCIEV